MDEPPCASNTSPVTPDVGIRIPTSNDDEGRLGRPWSNKVEEDPWIPAILSLDGGGIRGYSSLLILQELMREIANWERELEEPGPANEASSKGDSNSKTDPYDPDELRPCHYFDFVYGTSTGGIIAVMIGRLRMTVPQCLEVYRQVGDDLFGHTRSLIPFTTKFHHKPLERAVKKVVSKHCPLDHEHPRCDGQDWFPWDSADTLDGPDVVRPQQQSRQTQSAPSCSRGPVESQICQSICVTAANTSREAYLLRTYPQKYSPGLPKWFMTYNEGADRLRIWEVTRATSAAPFYFAPLKVTDPATGKCVIFKDGGIRQNNPVSIAWSEFKARYEPSLGPSVKPTLLLSIGTGRTDTSVDGFAAETWPKFGAGWAVQRLADKFAVLKSAIIKFTECERQHRDMRSAADGEHSWYKRLNVDSGLEGMHLDDWVAGPNTDASPGSRVAKVPGGKTLRRLENATNAYLRRRYDPEVDSYTSPSVMLHQSAEKLVRTRRARECLARDDPEDRERWESFMGRRLRFGACGERTNGHAEETGKG